MHEKYKTKPKKTDRTAVILWKVNITLLLLEGKLDKKINKNIKDLSHKISKFNFLNGVRREYIFLKITENLQT